MKRTRVCGLVCCSQSAKRRPLMFGITMSVRSRSIFWPFPSEMMRLASSPEAASITEAAQDADGDVADADIVFD